jgi:DNA mismatch repair protein MutL
LLLGELEVHDRAPPSAHCTQSRARLPATWLLVYLLPVSRIRLLPGTLVNQIAAGEVVERPASIVKELVENALDAGASTVRVRLEGGGRELVEVIDDGCGMDAEDARLALERHATSKIASVEDLDRIATLGFRGEALPSIAAVSRLLLETAIRDGDGVRVTAEHGELSPPEACSRPRGTRVEVRELFARLPARRKFLRTDATELRHSLTAITALALTRPRVGFRLEHNERRLLDLAPARDLAQRLPDLIGAGRAAAARPLALERGDVRISGMIFPTSGGRDLIVAVNGRVVRDRLLSGAVNRAIRDAHGTPEADLFLELRLPPELVDVNVHPTKAEVRLRDPGAVLAAVAAAVAAAKAAIHAPAPVRTVVATPSPSVQGAPEPRRHEEPPRAWTAPWPRSTPHIGEALPTSAAIGAGTVTSWGRLIGQFRETYLVVEDADGLLLVDQHVAHERVLYERLLASDTRPPVQRMLLPELLELPPQQVVLAEESRDAMSEVGVEVEVASGGTLRVLGIPAPLPADRAAELVSRLLRDLADAADPRASLRERMAASLACQAAIKKNRPLGALEATRLLADLATVRDPHRCPHGRPIMLRLGFEEIERRIGRR